MGEIFRLAPCITCHAWNADRTRVALCPNTADVWIFARQGQEWVKETVLQQHDSVVTGIDWAPTTNRLVTCAQDRNAYVWHYEGGEYKPTLVILRINRAATHVKWSPNEDKFAVASGAKVVSVCHFEEDNDWWVSKHIKIHRSTVTKVAWHPNNFLLATTSTDFRARVFSAAIKRVDRKPSPSDVPPAFAGGKVTVFGEQLWEWVCSAWVHSIAWSPSGNAMCFVGHDSTISFVNTTYQPAAVQTIKMSGLPLVDVMFLSEDKVVGGGHDCTPIIFANNGGTWGFSKRVGLAPSGEAAAGAGRGRGLAQSSAFKMFQNKVDRGTDDAASVATKLDTLHQNTITCLKPFRASGGVITEFTSSGLDGNIGFWRD